MCLISADAISEIDVGVLGEFGVYGINVVTLAYLFWCCNTKTPP